jgi:prepilin-type N-terminal cleavage/methylation domain-containing protein
MRGRKMKRYRDDSRNQEGFTLLELLVSLGILAIILSIVSSAMGSYSRILGSITDERANLNEARLAVEKITDIVHQERKVFNNNITLQLNSSETILQGIVGSDVYDLINIVPSGGQNGARLYLDNNRELRDGSNNLIARYIETITFQKYDANQVSVAPLSGDPIQVAPDSKFIKVTVTADKKQDDIDSCTIETILHYK